MEDKKVWRKNMKDGVQEKKKGEEKLDDKRR